MKNLKLLLAIVSIGAVTTFSSCSKDDDSDGGTTGGGNNNPTTNTDRISTGVWGIDSIQFTDQATPPTTITLPDSVFGSHTWGLNFSTNGTVALTGTTVSFSGTGHTWSFNTAETIASIIYKDTSGDVTVDYAWSDADKTLVGSWNGVLIIGTTQIPGTFTEFWGQ